MELGYLVEFFFCVIFKSHKKVPTNLSALFVIIYLNDSLTSSDQSQQRDLHRAHGLSVTGVLTDQTLGMAHM